MKEVAILLLSLLVLSCQRPVATVVVKNDMHKQQVPVIQHPKNVILMIGDGMGITQITAGMYSNGNFLHLEKFPVVGLHKSYSADDLITDSAAGATAFSCGLKTYNEAIGVAKDTTACRTILEEAENQGLSTGMVTTSTIVHATPASFIAHVKHRKMYEAIATYFVDSGIDFFIGGGKKYFDRRETDNRNLSEELRQKDYVIADYFEQEFHQLQVDPLKKFGYFTADGDPLMVEQGRDYLKPATSLALEHLRSNGEKGFFLMVEGAQIDWGGHANNSNYIIQEMIDFDQAIGVALDFAKADGETLVIVTADHETGGYAINPGSTVEKIISGFTTDKHTGALIPVFAVGPGSELFAGIYENTEIYNKMMIALRFRKL